MVRVQTDHAVFPLHFNFPAAMEFAGSWVKVGRALQEEGNNAGLSFLFF